MNSIWPFWDGNEVWGITAGTALFAVFPAIYALLLSSLYPVIMALIAALIFRAASFEFWWHVENGRVFWGTVFTISSFIIPLIIGLAFGNIIFGIPVDRNGQFNGSFLSLINPYSVLLSFMGLSAVLMQGITYVITRTTEKLKEKAVKIGNWIWIVALILFFILAVVSVWIRQQSLSRSIFWIGMIISMAALGTIKYLLINDKYKGIFLAASVFFIGIWITMGAIQYPNMVTISGNMNHNLTVFNISSPIFTMKIMTLITLAGMTVVIAYSIFVYRLFRGKIKPDEFNY
jgi:cytochrome d ubiquinol oxidase subunit II